MPICVCGHASVHGLSLYAHAPVMCDVALCHPCAPTPACTHAHTCARQQDNAAPLLVHAAVFNPHWECYLRHTSVCVSVSAHACDVV
eukprot:1586583-Alexandrium_andersonii.AAC.1